MTSNLSVEQARRVNEAGHCVGCRIRLASFTSEGMRAQRLATINCANGEYIGSVCRNCWDKAGGGGYAAAMRERQQRSRTRALARAASKFLREHGCA